MFASASNLPTRNRRSKWILASLCLAICLPLHADLPDLTLSDSASGANGWVLTATQAGARLSGSDGYGVTPAGDVNRDGIGDFAMGAYLQNGNGNGRVYIVFGRAGQAPTTMAQIDAGNTGQGYYIDGAQAGGLGEGLGNSLCRLGDVNGDSYADIAIGGELYNAGQGAVYVAFGKNTTTPMASSDLATGGRGIRFLGEGTFSFVGRPLRNAGDVNGDGYTDLLIGAHNADGGGTDRGVSYLVFLNPTMQGDYSLSSIGTPTLPGFRINGEFNGDFTGLSSDAGLDVNGDGLSDIAVGGGGLQDLNGTEAGRVYVVFGKDDFAPVECSQITAGVGGYAITGTVNNGDLGRRIAMIHDANGDGRAEIAVQHGSNLLHVIFGKSTGSEQTINQSAMSSGGYSVTMTMQSIQFFHLSRGGDSNRDGRGDLLIGSQGFAGPNGAAYFVAGKNTTSVIDLRTYTATSNAFAIVGFEALPGNFTGEGAAYIVRVPDLNADSTPDFLVGHPWSDIGGTDAGRVYGVFSKSFTPLVTTYTQTANDGIALVNFPNDSLSLLYADGAASTETATFGLENSSISGLPAGSDVLVATRLSTDRIGWTSAVLEMSYDDTGLGTVQENGVRIYRSPSATSGPWTQLPNPIDPGANVATLTVSELGLYALVAPELTAAAEWQSFE